ncbi:MULTISPECIES: heparin lyase I family protein [unclassified Rhizobium]|uniref:heparin lyase I family protein n=1 Tax=unclassified Rhizobium TaxID=2613769 RepID=UPI0037FBABDD
MTIPRTLQLAFLLSCLGLLNGSSAAAQNAAPASPGSFADLCTASSEHPSKLWKISSRLDPALWGTRIACDLSSPSRPILRITVHPGDASDQSVGDAPTERVEIQVKREIVKFDRPIWYHFAFRLEAPWQGIGNRTVIHQVKQNIPTEDTKPLGSCQSANPLFKIEAIPSATGADFVAKVRGTADCNAGRSKTVCGPWHLNVGDWNDVNVMLKPSLQEGESALQVYLNGRACDIAYTGRLGYVDHGMRDQNGRPFIDTQPRFGIYRDALPDVVQSIDFADIQFWPTDPSGDPTWAKQTTFSK